MERKSAQPPQGALLCLSLSPQHSMGPQQPGLCSPLPQPPDPLNLGWCRCSRRRTYIWPPWSCSVANHCGGAGRGREARNELKPESGGHSIWTGGRGLGKEKATGVSAPGHYGTAANPSSPVHGHPAQLTAGVGPRRSFTGSGVDYKMTLVLSKSLILKWFVLEKQWASPLPTNPF